MNLNGVITNKSGQWRWRQANACASMFVIQRFKRNDYVLFNAGPSKTAVSI